MVTAKEIIEDLKPFITEGLSLSTVKIAVSTSGATEDGIKALEKDFLNSGEGPIKLLKRELEGNTITLEVRHDNGVDLKAAGDTALSNVSYQGSVSVAKL